MKIFDIETNGFLDVLTCIHCMWVYDTDTKEWLVFNSQGNGVASIEEGLTYLETGDLLAHFGIGFDYLAIKKVYPKWKPTGMLYDSVLDSQLIWPTLKELDFAARAKGKWRLPLTGDAPCPEKMGGIIGSHSLKAWGHRLGEYKTTIAGDDGITDWSIWTQDMEDYCKQDVVVTKHLYDLIEYKNVDVRARNLEAQFAVIMKRQETFGFKFNEEEAEELLKKLLIRKAGLSDALQKLFPPWERITDPNFIPKVNNKTLGYVKGVPFVKRKTIVFNPGSRDHIADRLTALYGWKPKVFTNGGKPQVDESVLSELDYECCPTLMDYLMIEKRLGMLSEGKQAWLKSVLNGRIHGRVKTLGAITGRCTHSNPNVAQVPSVTAEYGSDCRSLFTVDEGFKLVGADASGLELRCLAHYMARYDKGAYAEVILNGDIHTVNQTAAGLLTRDQAKTFIYGFL
jgi:hypothetical protein